MQYNLYNITYRQLNFWLYNIAASPITQFLKLCIALDLYTYDLTSYDLYDLLSHLQQDKL